jgi:hypothetical protein
MPQVTASNVHGLIHGLTDGQKNEVCQWDMVQSSDFNLFKKLAAQLWGHRSQHEVNDKNTSVFGSKLILR